MSVSWNGRQWGLASLAAGVAACVGLSVFYIISNQETPGAPPPGAGEAVYTPEHQAPQFESISEVLEAPAGGYKPQIGQSRSSVDVVWGEGEERSRTQTSGGERVVVEYEQGTCTFVDGKLTACEPAR